MTSHGSFHCFNTKRARQISNSSFVCTHCAPVINDPTLTRPSHQTTTHTLLLQVSSGFCSTPIQTPDLTLSGLLVFHPHNWAYTQKFCPLQPRSRPYQSLKANHRLLCHALHANAPKLHPLNFRTRLPSNQSDFPMLCHTH